MTDSTSPADDVKQALVDALHETFDSLREIDDDTYFFDSGALDSLDWIDMVALIEDRFGISISAEDANEENLGSKARAAAYVARRLETRADSR